MGCSTVHIRELLKPQVGEGREQFLKQEALSVVRWAWGWWQQPVVDTSQMTVGSLAAGEERNDIPSRRRILAVSRGEGRPGCWGEVWRTQS